MPNEFSISLPNLQLQISQTLKMLRLESCPIFDEEGFQITTGTRYLKIHKILLCV